MSHKVQVNWCKHIKVAYPQFFKNVKVLDIGSLDVNGNIKHMFKESEYIGLDVVEGKNVDVVSIAHEYKAELESFDVVCSCNSFEHDMHYEKTIKKMIELLKPNGLMFFICANSFPEHGTKEHTDHNSGTTMIGDDKWANYYKNLSVEDIKNVIDLSLCFHSYDIEVALATKNEDPKDLRFIGIKK